MCRFHMLRPASERPSHLQLPVLTLSLRSCCCCYFAAPGAATLAAATAAAVALPLLPLSFTEDPQLGWSFSHGVSIKRYCSGMGFILTYDVTKYVADNAANLYKGYPEDAVVGLWFAGTVGRGGSSCCIQSSCCLWVSSMLTLVAAWSAGSVHSTSHTTTGFSVSATASPPTATATTTTTPTTRHQLLLVVLQTATTCYYSVSRGSLLCRHQLQDAA